ncbi:hypothetical protein K438DRAFT_1764568 [Mycena galopus ATCC 62051]|nr:hypothetical protein K438DRAFT_1764568 [Mycena galopus ATCC 62051]
MAPKPWATAEQKLWLLNWMPDFIKRQAEGKLHLFWPPMPEGWFQRYPEEKDLKLPLPTDQDKRALTSEEVLKLGAAILVRKGSATGKLVSKPPQKNRDRGRQHRPQPILQQGLGVAKRCRAHQPIEIFQKRNPEAIKEVLVEAGYDLQNAKQDTDEFEDTPAARLKRTKSDRMCLHMRVMQGLWAKASPEERAAITMTPEQRQQGVDALEAVFAEMHKAAYLATGWVVCASARQQLGMTLRPAAWTSTPTSSSRFKISSGFVSGTVAGNRDSTTWALPATLDMVADDRPIERLIAPPTPPATEKPKPSKKSGSKSKKSKLKSKHKASAVVEKAGLTLPASDTEEDSELDTRQSSLENDELTSLDNNQVSPWDRAESPEWETLDDEASGGTASLHDEAAPLRDELGDLTTTRNYLIPQRQACRHHHHRIVLYPNAKHVAATITVSPAAPDVESEAGRSWTPYPTVAIAIAITITITVTTACHRGRVISAQYYRNTRQRQDRVPFGRVIYDDAHRPRSPSFVSASDTLPAREAPVACGPTAAGVAPASEPRAACKGAGKAAAYPNVHRPRFPSVVFASDIRPAVSPLPESRPPVNPVPPAKASPKSRKKAIGAKAAGKEVAAAGAKKVVSVAEVVKRKPGRPRKTPLDDVTNAIVGAEAAPPVSARTPVVYTSTNNNRARAHAAAEAEKAAKIKEGEDALAKQATKGWVQSTVDGATVVTLTPLNPLTRARKATKYPDGSAVPAVRTTAALAAKKKLNASEAALLARTEANTGAKRKASKSEKRARVRKIKIALEGLGRKKWDSKEIASKKGCLYGGLKPSSSAARLQTNGFPAVTGTCGVGVDDLEGKIQFGVHGAFHGALKVHVHTRCCYGNKKPPVIEEVMDGTCLTPRETTCIRVRKKWAGGRREVRPEPSAAHGAVWAAARCGRSGWERGGGSGRGGADLNVPERGAGAGGRRAAEARGKGPANRKASRNQGLAASRSKAGKRVGRPRRSQPGHSQPRVALAARGIGDRGERKGCKRALGAEGIPAILGAGGVFLLSFLVEGNGK